ncbi:MAG: hypothetical protein O3A80_04650 [bacterium]|nr:hypothetical protein [bacterium]
MRLKLEDAKAPAVDGDVDQMRSEISKAVEEAENIFIGNPEYFSSKTRVAEDLKKFSQMGKLCPVDALSVGLPQKNAETSIMSYSIYTSGGNEPVHARQYLEAAAVYYNIITEKDRKSKGDVSLRKLDETLLRLKLFALGKPIEDIAGFHSGPAKQAVVAPPDKTSLEIPPATGGETLPVEPPAAPPPVESPAAATATTPQNIFNNNTVVMGGAESKKEKKKRKKEKKRREQAEADLTEAIKVGAQTLEEQKGKFKDFVDRLQAEHNDALAKESQAAKDAAEAFDAERSREAASRNNTHSSDLNPEEARVVLAFLRDYSPLFTNATSFSVDENDHVVAVFFPGVTADMRVGDVNWPSNDAIPFTDNYRKSKDKYPPPDMFIPGSDFERKEDLVRYTEAVVARTTPILPSTAGWGPANSPVRRTAEQTRHRFNTIHGAGSMMHNMMNHLTTDRSNGGAFPPTTNPTQRTAPQPAPRQQKSATDNTPEEAGAENAQRGAA